MNARPPEIPPHKLLRALREYNLLPAIVFLPTRRKCDEAAAEAAGDRSQKIDADRQTARRELFQNLAADYPEIAKHKHRDILVNAGVASHHAGHIPAWKLVVEKMMGGGLLNAIFATSTVAAGVDFPARTVVLSNADTRGNDGWRPLSASELQQMTGRAGRRGKDNVGFVILTPGQFQNPRKIAEILRSPPDPLESQFRATYTSLLNLLDAFGSFAHVRSIAEKSFAEQATSRQNDRLKAEHSARIRAIEQRIEGNEFGVTAADARAFERLVSVKGRLDQGENSNQVNDRQNWLRGQARPGRVVTQGRGARRLFLIFNVHGDKVSAMRDDGQGATFALERVRSVYDNVYSLSEAATEQAFDETFSGKNRLLQYERPHPSQPQSNAAATTIDSVINAFLAEKANGGVSDAVRTFLWECTADASEAERLAAKIDANDRRVWLPFERRAKVLDRFGYIDFARERVTESGKWLADVRVDRPLLVGEALRRKIFERLDPAIAAGLMASLAADSERSYGELYQSNALLDVINSFEDVIFDVSNTEWQNGVEPSEEINLSAAAAAERWAGGMRWDELVARTKAEEGDLVRLLSRTGEALLQIAHLKNSHLEASRIASQAAYALLRPPVK